MLVTGCTKVCGKARQTTSLAAVGFGFTDAKWCSYRTGGGATRRQGRTFYVGGLVHTLLVGVGPRWVSE